MYVGCGCVSMCVWLWVCLYVCAGVGVFLPSPVHHDHFDFPHIYLSVSLVLPFQLVSVFYDFQIEHHYDLNAKSFQLPLY